MAWEQERDLEPTRRRLEAWLRRKLPTAEALRVSGLEAPGNGFSNETLLFDLDWQEAGNARHEALVARLEPAFRVFPHYDLGRQFRVLELLADTPVPVPRARWQEPDPEPLGAPFYVMERVEGRIPPDRPPYHAGGWCAELPPEQRMALWWSGVDALGEIHRLDWRARGFGFLEEDAGRDPLERQLADYRRYLEWAAEGRPQPTAETGLAWLEAERPASAPPALCWGDARIGNMIFREQRCVAVLDWEMVTLADPEQDLGWWLFIDWHHSTGIDVPRLEGLPERDATIARWEARTGRAAKHVHYHEVFAAFRFSVIMIRVAAHLKSLSLPIPDDFERNNPCVRGLARFLGLPAPGDVQEVAL